MPHYPRDSKDSAILSPRQLGQRVAMRQGSAVYYLYGDHLGSTSLITNASGATLTETRHEPYGQSYWQWGATRTDYGFTGQRLDGFGLMDYNARFYSSTLGRFVSPDSIIPQPGSPQAWDRYSYVNSNPVNGVDPSGHVPVEGCGDEGKEACHASDLEAAQNAQKENLLLAEFEKSQCDAGNSNYCSFAKNHPTETITFVATNLILAGLADPALLGSASELLITTGRGIAAAGQEAIQQVVIACLLNPVCQQVISKTYDSRVKEQADTFHNFPSLLDSIILKYGEKSINGPFINFSIEGTITTGGKIYSGFYQIGVVIEKFVPKIVHHFFKPQ